MSRVVRSAIWLAGCSAVGYGLLITISTDERLIKEKHPELQHSEVKKRTKEIVDTLKLAASSQKPLYRQSKEEIDNELKKVE